MRGFGAFSCLGLAACLAGCTKPAPRNDAPKPEAVDVGAASTVSTVSGSYAPEPPDARAGASAPPVTSGEAHRFVVARFDEDPLLRAQAAVLREHFNAGNAGNAAARDGAGNAAARDGAGNAAARDGARGPFAVQRIDLATGAKALLVARADESDPIVLAVDRDRLEWQKPRPVAGMVLPAGHVTLSPRPDGGAGVFVWVEKLQTVAARMWADDGNAFGDFEVFKPERCDSLSVAYGPGMGWIVACASPGGVRAARLREDATLASDPVGVALGSGHATGPVAIAVDSPSSFVLVEPAAAVAADRLLAFRYDTNFAPLWPSPVDLGLAGRHPGRPDASAVSPGLVRIEAARTPNAPLSPPVEITSSGEVRRLQRDRPLR